MNIVIFKAIKKPLAVRHSQVIHKVVIQNPVIKQGGLRQKKWLLLDGVIISNCPSEKAPPPSPADELNLCHLGGWASFLLAFSHQTDDIRRKAQTYLPGNYEV